MSTLILSIGIDPGMYGAVAVLLFSDGVMIDARTIRRDKHTDYELADELRQALSLGKEGELRLVSMETNTIPRPPKGKEGKEGKVNFNLASIQKQAANSGQYQGMLAALGASYTKVTPSVWQKPLGLIKTNKSETYSAKKKRHRELAQRLYPALGIINETADAVLIAHWNYLYHPLLNRSNEPLTDIGTPPKTKTKAQAQAPKKAAPKPKTVKKTASTPTRKFKNPLRKG